MRRSWTKWIALFGVLLALGLSLGLSARIRVGLENKRSFVIATDDLGEATRLQAELSARSAVELALEQARRRRAQDGVAAIDTRSSAVLPVSFVLWSGDPKDYTVWLREEDGEVHVKARTVVQGVVGAASAVARVTSSSVQVLRWESVEAIPASER